MAAPYGCFKRIVFPMALKKILSMIGVESDNTSHSEKAISIAGGFIGIFLTLWISAHYAGLQGAALLIASMGSSSVLLFAVPHSTFAQPWPLVGGHFICTLIGVFCAQTVANPFIAAPLSVALSIAAMRYLRCIHPPAGGTTLVPVIGGPEVQALGYLYAFTPVLLNSFILLLTAIAVNYAFPWRRYPAYFSRLADQGVAPASLPDGTLQHEDFIYAMKEMGSYVDITDEDMAKIYELAVKHAQRSPK